VSKGNRVKNAHNDEQVQELETRVVREVSELSPPARQNIGSLSFALLENVSKRRTPVRQDVLNCVDIVLELHKIMQRADKQAAIRGEIVVPKRHPGQVAAAAQQAMHQKKG
jgi:hypothetical protein